MRMLMSILLQLIWVTSQVFTQITSIGSLHINDSSGRPIAPFAIGTPVTVTGIVTVPTDVLSTRYFEIYLQDPTGGINIFSYTKLTTVQLGDSITVTGKIAHYNGLTEILGDDTNPLTVVVHSAGHKVPEPLVLTCNELANSFYPDYTEPNESRLVQVNAALYTMQQSSSGGILGTLRDDTGECLIYLDVDTGVPEPSGRINVVGFLKQYDTTAPYTTGYEIIPRYASDINQESGPTITASPVETNIQPTEVTIFWRTRTPATGTIDYGQTTDYELGQVTGTENVTDHYVTITGLTPTTFYHCRAISKDATGQSASSDLLFSTAAPADAPGRMSVHFNQSVNTALAVNQEADGLANFELKLVDAINRTRFSIDVCMHNLTLEVVRDVLIAAQNRGVKIRYIYEHENTANITELKNAGIPCIDDRFGNNDGQGYMHNKFIIFNARDPSSAADDMVWTGSFNATTYGKDLNAENVVIIQDQAVAQAFTAEFNEMWGSAADTPNSATAKFGSNKTDNTPHRFNVGGIPVQIYFSPGDQVATKIIHVINSANNNIYFCIYSFTRNDISNAMRDKWYAGIKVKGVFDSDQINDPGSEYPVLAGTGTYVWSPPADVVLDRENGALHHKYMLVDPCDPSSDPVLVTGSYNWSISAETSNDENIVIINDANIVNQYLQEFAARYTRAGGTQKLCDPVHITVDFDRHDPIQDYLVLQTYPNPFNNQVQIQIHGFATEAGDFRIYNYRGELVKSWHQRLQHQVTWNATDDAGHQIATGIYFITLKSGTEFAVAKALYLR